MADAKITSLTAASTLHANDVFVVVDTTDTSMAATGTDKKATLTQLTAAVKTPPGGSPAQVQYNGAGSFAGASALAVGGSGQLNLGLISNTTIADGDLWYRAGTSGKGLWFRHPLASQRFGGVIFSCGAGTPVAGTTAETSLFAGFADGMGSLTIPANTLAVGHLIRITFSAAWGYTGTPTLTFKVKLGAIVILQSIAATAPTGSAGASAFTSAPILLGVLTTGSGGSVGGGGLILLISTTGPLSNILAPGGGAGGISAVTVDTTVPLAIDVTLTWSVANASNTFGLKQCLIELLN